MLLYQEGEKMKKVIKIPFEIILRNKKTKEEIKVGDLSLPVKIEIDKKAMNKIMKVNSTKGVKDDKDERSDTVR